MKNKLSKIFSKLNFLKYFKKNNYSLASKQLNFDKKLVQSLSSNRIPNWKQIKHVAKFFSSKEKIIIKILSLFIVASVVFLGINLYRNKVIYLPKSGGEYTEGLIGVPMYINPLLSQTNDIDMDISKLVFSSLLKYDKDLNLVEDLAASYQISEDQKEYTFFLRQDVKWHDREMFNADDVIFTFNKILDPEVKSPLLITFQGIILEKIDDYTVKFKLEEPFAPFLSTLTFGILPQHSWNEVASGNFNLAGLNLKPNGTGPFEFKSLVKDKNGNIKSYTLNQNPDFYANKPYLDTIIFKFYPDFQSAVEALKNKNILGISYLPKNLKQEIQDTKPYHFISLNLPQYSALFINQKGNKILLDNNIRQAMAYAIDRQKIVAEVLNNEGKIIDSPILEGFIGHNPDVKQYNYNLQKAEEILNSTDWKKEDDGFRKKDDQVLEITLTTVNKQENQQTAEIIKQNFETIGIKLNIKLVDALVFQSEVIKPRNYQLLLYSEIIGSDPDPFPFWHSSQMEDPGLSLSIFTNKKIDSLLEEARSTADINERAGKYKEFQNLLAQDLVAVFLYNPTYTYVITNKVQGFDLERITNPSDRFINIDEWYIKTKKSFRAK